VLGIKTEIPNPGKSRAFFPEFPRNSAFSGAPRKGPEYGIFSVFKENI